MACLLAALAVGCPRTAEGPAGPDELPPPEAPGWVQPFLDEFDELPPTGAAGMYAIARERVGPLYADMPAELQFLQRIFTDFDVRVAVERDAGERAGEVFEVLDEGARVLVVEPEDGAPHEGGADIERVRVHSSLFSSPDGLGVGDRFEAIARAHGPLECRAGQAAGGPVAICRGPDDGDPIRWVFASPGAMPDTWLSPAASAERLAGSTASEVWWRPPEAGRAPR